MNKNRIADESRPTVPRPSVSGTNSARATSKEAAHSPVSGLKIVTISPGTESIPDVESGVERRRSNADRDPYLGATVDNRYKIEAVLGEGGMGVVYLCRHTIIDKRVAMKVLRADLARDQDVTERFLNEAKAASAIGNPHIIDISDFGQLPDGATYFVMEYLDGEPLSGLMGEGRPVPVPRIVHIGRQLAEGLAAAHNAGIIHRDLKPDNIYLVTRGKETDFVKILDFGIAKVASVGSKLTQAGQVFGTPHYMSPEQAAGAPIDYRCDTYSLGVILYEMASGKVPFDADNFMGILTQHMYKAPVPFRALVPQPQDVPPGLEAIVLKCLSKRPEQRYQSMDEVIVDLDRVRDGLIPAAVNEMMGRSAGFNVPSDYFSKAAMPAPVPAQPADTRDPKNRWPLYAGLAGVLAAIAIVTGIFARTVESTASPAPVPQPQAPSASVAAVLAAPGPDPSELPDPITDVVFSKQVLLAVEPLDAVVYEGDRKLGSSPVALQVEEGQTVTLRIARDGYQEQTIEVDGSKDKLLVTLEKEALPAALRPHAAPHPASRPRPKPKPIGGGDIVNPWD